MALRPGAELDEDAIRRWLDGRLARHRVPKRLTAVDELPRNAAGKVVRREVAARLATASDAG